MVFMLWHVFMNLYNIASALSLSTRKNAAFLSWFLNVVTINLRLSSGVHLILGRNTKGYEVAEHIDTKVEVNPQMISTLKNAKSIWSMNPWENVEKSMVGPLGILLSFFNRQLWHGSSKSGMFVGRPSKSNFLEISFSLSI